jgi:hypothetical protein
VYELVNEEALRSGFQIDLADGTIATFPLIAFPFEDLLENKYIRLSINPMIDRADRSLPTSITTRIVQFNYETAWVRLNIDPDEDIELCGELPAALCNEANFDLLLQTLVDYASVVYQPLQELLAEEPQSEAGEPLFGAYAQDLVDQYGTELHLDYSAESLGRFEQQIDSDFRAFLQAENLLEANARAYGAYIGEVLVRQGNAHWEIAEPLETSSVVMKERRFQPLRMAHAFLESDQALRPSQIVQRALAR